MECANENMSWTEVLKLLRLSNLRRREGDYCASTEAVPHKPAAAPAPLAAASSLNQIQPGCDDLQDPQHRFTCIPESPHQPSRNDTNITFIWHFTVHRTIHQDWARSACLPMLSFTCLELTTFIHHQQRLSDDLQISAENLLFFRVSFNCIAYTSDLITFPPAPLKLRPYGVI